MKCQLLIPAAGVGKRLGLNRPKALANVGGGPLQGGEPLLVRTLKRFQPLGLVEGAVIIAPVEHEPEIEEALRTAFPYAEFRFAPGGSERQISVGNGLACLDTDTEVVVIHDAARPFVTAESVQASINAAWEHGAATVAIPSIDTVLQSDADAFLVGTPDRRQLWLCQTPQTFRVPVIREAHERARRDAYLGTDDASLVRRAGFPVKLVMGTPLNFKVTTATDLALAECVIREGLA